MAPAAVDMPIVRMSRRVMPSLFAGLSGSSSFRSELSVSAPEPGGPTVRVDPSTSWYCTITLSHTRSACGPVSSN